MLLCLSFGVGGPANGIEHTCGNVPRTDAGDEFLPVARDHCRLVNHARTVCEIRIGQNNAALRRPVASRGVAAQVVVETHLAHRKRSIFNRNVVELKDFRDLSVVARVKFVEIDILDEFKVAVKLPILEDGGDGNGSDIAALDTKLLQWEAWTYTFDA